MVDSIPHTKRQETFTAPESGFLWLANVERFEEWDKSEKHVTWETLKEYPVNVWTIVLQKASLDITHAFTPTTTPTTHNHKKEQKNDKKIHTTPKEALTLGHKNNYQTHAMHPITS